MDFQDREREWADRVNRYVSAKLKRADLTLMRLPND
jgi:hypothetical protein